MIMIVNMISRSTFIASSARRRLERARPPRPYRDRRIQRRFHVHHRSRVVDGGVTATGVLSRERGNLITISITLY
jgi:hypothetical protein